MPAAVRCLALKSKINPSVMTFSIKLILFAWAFTFGLPLALLCQGETVWSLGARLGYNSANASLPEASPLWLPTGGLTLTYSVNEKYGTVVDLLLSGEGFRDGKNDYTLHYLRIPIIYTAFLGQLGQRLRPKIGVGLAPGLLLSGKINDATIDTELYRHLALDLAGDVGANLRVAELLWLNLDARAFFGFNKFHSSQPGKLRTVSLTLGLTYGF